MFVIGDVHGKFKDYLDIIADLPGKSLQLGDFGIGFGKDPIEWNKDHLFIRGNHDDPKKCRKHPNYLGEYGITEDKVFFVSGGYSIDYRWRRNHNLLNPNDLVWWEDEEISQDEFPKIIDMYMQHKPEIVVAHDAPPIVKAHVVDGDFEDKRQFINRTSDGLMEEMFKLHKPKIWVFGHYHCSVKIELKGTLFVGLEELEVFELNTGV